MRRPKLTREERRKLLVALMLKARRPSWERFLMGW